MLVLRITVTIFAWTPSENEPIGTTSGLDQYHLMKTKYTRFFYLVILGQKHVFPLIRFHVDVKQCATERSPFCSGPNQSCAHRMITTTPHLKEHAADGSLE